MDTGAARRRDNGPGARLADLAAECHDGNLAGVDVDLLRPHKTIRVIFLGRNVMVSWRNLQDSGAFAYAQRINAPECAIHEQPKPEIRCPEIVTLLGVNPELHPSLDRRSTRPRL